VPDVSLKLKDAQIDFAYSSDLDRAVQTAEEILRFYLQVCLVRVKELREQAKGVYEGKPKEEISNAVERLGLEWYEFRPEGGETLRDTWERVVGWYGELSAKHKTDSILLVSHGGPIACLLAYLHGEPIQKFRKYLPRENTAVSVIELDETGALSKRS